MSFVAANKVSKTLPKQPDSVFRKSVILMDILRYTVLLSVSEKNRLKAPDLREF